MACRESAWPRSRDPRTSSCGLPGWFARLHPTYQTPINSIVFVGAVTLAFSVLGLIGVGKQEAFQLLWNASGIFYGLTYLVMFADREHFRVLDL